MTYPRFNTALGPGSQRNGVDAVGPGGRRIEAKDVNEAFARGAAGDPTVVEDEVLSRRSAPTT